jgi:hypothetical protein
LKNKIQSHTCDFHLESLKSQRSFTFSSVDLPLVDYSFKATDIKGQPIFYFLKGALRWPFEKDPTSKASEALSQLIDRYPPPPPKTTDERHKGKIIYL